jgi:predicted peptidase
MKPILISLLICGNAIQLFSQDNPWIGFQEDSIVSSLDNAVQKFYYYKSSETDAQPLVVSLHQWSSGYSSFGNSLAHETKAKNWNYIRPDFRGPNNHFKACGSKYAIEDIDEAIDWAIENLPVDKKRIYVVGASGGGHAALCSFMKSRHNIKEFSAWVPITDLKRWYFETKSRGLKYASDIIKCTCSGCDEIDLKEAENRSPLYWETPVKKLEDCRLKIYAGIHDGHTGSVPIAHSILFYNKIIEDMGGDMSDKVSCEEMNWMLTTRTAPGKTTGKIGDRDILYFKALGNVSLVIFEGGHEMLGDEVLPSY